MEFEVSFHKACPLSALFYSRVLDDGGLWQGDHTVWKWAWFHMTEESLRNGLTIALRMLGFVTFGLLFTSTTDLTAFMMSLIHQCKMSPKWAYGMLAGFRFIPLFQSELKQMKAAHKIRGYKQKTAGKPLCVMHCHFLHRAYENQNVWPLRWKQEASRVRGSGRIIMSSALHGSTICIFCSSLSVS